jgi:rRNA maturation endonuclease Nob1
MMTDDWLDFYLDNILKASGSALKHYSMQKTKDDMRQALRQAIAGLESQEHNFCPRCGKRTNDIHTCTPPQDNT